MPKYYVSVHEINVIVVDDDPVGACIKVTEKKSLVTCGFKWKVSERGFDDHKDDIYINDDIINKEAIKRKKQ